MPFTNFRILIVDDDLSHLDQLDAKIKALNAHQVFRSDCGENAVATLLSMERSVDCVLCNYGMPRGNGLQLLQHVRMGRIKTLRPDACVLVFSSDRSPRIVKAARDLDASGYLVTPFTPSQLVAAVTKGRSRYFKADFAKYAAVEIPEYVAGGAHHPQEQVEVAAVDPNGADESDESGRRAMANMILQSFREKKEKASPEPRRSMGEIIMADPEGH